MRVAVAGGTGVVGRHVMEALSASGHTPVALARSRGVDLLTGVGVDEALAGADVVVDVSNVATTSRRRSVGFFETATTRLLQAGHRAGVRHHVVLSIVGVDRVNSGYYAGKRRQEELALAGPVPATVLRATQFHEFAAQLFDRRGPLVIAPKLLCQPVAVAEVAETTAFGAALLAGVGADLLTLSQVAELGDERARYEPGISEDERETLLDGWHRALERARGWAR